MGRQEFQEHYYNMNEGEHAEMDKVLKAVKILKVFSAS